MKQFVMRPQIFGQTEKLLIYAEAFYTGRGTLVCVGGTVVLLREGFRPFFLGAGLFAALAMILWFGYFQFGWSLPVATSPALWHGHEMIFGFVAAAIAGFILTALPNWTGTEPVAGRWLAALVALWVAGRLLLATSAIWPAGLVAIVDTAFLVSLAGYVGWALIESQNWRNLVFLAAIATVIGGNLLFHAEQLGLADDVGSDGLRLALNGIVLLIAIIGGRIIPAFTRNALDREGITHDIEPRAWLDVAAIIAVFAIIPADLFGRDTLAAAAVTLVAAILNTLRFLTWQSERTLGMPIVWSLHLGYFWLIVGLFMKGLAASLPSLAGIVWIHAITIGAVGTMVMAVMTRATLGHTGGVLVASRTTAIAYGAVSLSAVSRIIAPEVPDVLYLFLLGLSAVAWIAVFAVFVVEFWPRLTGPTSSE